LSLTSKTKDRKQIRSFAAAGQWEKMDLMTGCRAFLSHLVFIFAATASADPLHVMIDPGHGGSDTGAARGSIKESEIALKVSLKLSETLKQDPRFKVSLTRTTDRKVALPTRTRLAQDAHADLFVSIHLNSSTDARAKGTEIYFQNQLPADEEAMFLVSQEHGADSGATEPSAAQEKPEPLSAKSDLKRILEDLHRNHRIHSSSEMAKVLIEQLAQSQARGRHQVRQAPFQVVQNIEIPSVLVELGFITHPVEGPRLQRDDYQNELVQALFTGLAKYKETVDKQAAEKLRLQALAR